jgi:hypothetical protein
MEERLLMWSGTCIASTGVTLCYQGFVAGFLLHGFFVSGRVGDPVRRRRRRNCAVLRCYAESLFFIDVCFYQTVRDLPCCLYGAQTATLPESSHRY